VLTRQRLPARVRRTGADPVARIRFVAWSRESSYKQRGLDSSSRRSVRLQPPRCISPESTRYARGGSQIDRPSAPGSPLHRGRPSSVPVDRSRAWSHLWCARMHARQRRRQPTRNATHSRPNPPDLFDSIALALTGSGVANLSTVGRVSDGGAARGAICWFVFFWKTFEHPHFVDVSPEQVAALGVSGGRRSRTGLPRTGQ
jgi:hypothetical protein